MRKGKPTPMSASTALEPPNVAAAPINDRAASLFGMARLTCGALSHRTRRPGKGCGALTRAGRRAYKPRLAGAARLRGAACSLLADRPKRIGVCCEAHLSTVEAGPQAPPWLPRPYG